jgi:DNA primase
MTIEEIKQKLTILQVLEHYRIQVKSHMCNCPFHEDNTPSMQVFEDSNTVRCYSGNCDKSNQVIDVIDFIMYKEELSKHQAITKTKDLIGFISSKPSRVRSREYQSLPMDRLEEVFTKMKSNLRQSNHAREYAQERSLDYENLEIGYNGRTYKGLVNCIVFPLRNKNHQIVSLYGRSIKDKGHYYLKDRSGLYPCYPKEETKILLLTESIIDTASILPIPLPLKSYSLLSCYGVNGFTEEHRQSVRELPNLEEVIIIFDMDESGEKGSYRLARELKTIKKGILITQIKLPNKDLNEVLQLHIPEIFTQLLYQRKELILSPEISDQAEQEKQPSPENLSLDQINDLIGKSGIIGEENTLYHSQQLPNPQSVTWDCTGE